MMTTQTPSNRNIGTRVSYAKVLNWGTVWIKDQKVIRRTVSLLSFAAVKQLTNGRTHISIGTIAQPLNKDLNALAKQHRIDVSSLLGVPRKPVSLLRWEYGHFAAKPVGLVAFSICHEDPTRIHLFARDLNLVNPSA